MKVESVKVKRIECEKQRQILLDLDANFILTRM